MRWDRYAEHYCIWALILWRICDASVVTGAASAPLMLCWICLAWWDKAEVNEREFKMCPFCAVRRSGQFVFLEAVRHRTIHMPPTQLYFWIPHAA